MKCSLVFLIGALVNTLVCVSEISGHGMMLDPPGRSSRWRFDSSAPTNYDDNGLYCGGYNVQWQQNGGKCGFCGDNYASPRPRANEIGGLYGGVGVITRTYRNTYTAAVNVRVTANHLGYFQFNLCNLDAFKVESDPCYDQYLLRFADGCDRLQIGTTTGSIDTVIVLPNGLSCDHCVLRWTYTAGNNWGTCADGSQATGCGPQETFISCADVSIYAPVDRVGKMDLTEFAPEIPKLIAEYENDKE